MADQPADTHETIKDLWDLLDSWRVFSNTSMSPKLIEWLKQQFQQKMTADNPFDPDADTTRHRSYADGWYAGYGLAFVGKLIVGGTILKAVKQTTIGQAIITGIERTPGLAQLLAAKRAVDRLQARAIAGLVRGAKWLATPVLKGAKSVGAAIETRVLIRHADVDASQLRDAAQERFGAFLRRSDKYGARVLGEVDTERIRRTFRAGDACGALYSGASATVSGNCLSDAELQRWGGVIRRSELDTDTLRKHVQAMDQLDDQAAALRLLEETGDDGIRAVNRLVDADDVDADAVIRRINEFDWEAKRGVTRALSDGVDAKRVSKSLERYDALDGEDGEWKEEFEELLAHHDPEVRNSWLRAAGDERFDSPKQAIKDGLKFYDELKGKHDVKKFQSGYAANENLPPKVENPYKDESMVVNFETRTRETFVRVYDPDDNLEGPYMMRAEDIEGLSEGEILRKFALKEEDWNVDYSKVAKVEVPRGKNVQVSTAGRQVDGDGDDATELPGGGKQYYMDDIDDVEFTPLGDIEDVTDDITDLVGSTMIVPYASRTVKAAASP